MLTVDGAVVRFGSRDALDGVDLEVAPGETVVVLGPSGSGKSTLLRAIAGLEPLASGQVGWNGIDVGAVPAHERQFGLMFQDYALFPHRDVRGNVEFGLRMAGLDAGTRAKRVDEVLTLVGLDGYADRRVATLSGGEQQRVALARAIAPSPRLLMLDEPLGALDRVLRERLLDELRELLATAGLPALYVTHDHDEAFALADRVVVMRAGRVVQAGPPDVVWRAPADEWVAAFLGFGPAIDAPVHAGRAVTPWGDVPAPESFAGATTVRIVLRPGAVVLDPLARATGIIHRRTFGGDHVALAVQVGDAPLVVVRAPTTNAPAVGAAVAVAVDPDGVLVYGP
ncbi:MAG: potA2 [Actinomycetia bacterium]|nr:potA2 [Actinomycetes bacterium]